MSCEISCAEHSAPLAHSCIWQLWERVTAELRFAIWMVSFSEALQGQGDCKSLLGIFKGLTKELKAPLALEKDDSQPLCLHTLDFEAILALRSRDCLNEAEDK